MGEAGFILNKDELVCLSSFVSVLIYGIESNLAEKPHEEILDIWQTARRSLAEKKYLLDESDGDTVKVCFDRKLLKCVELCCHPEIILTLGGGSETGFIYITQGGGVVLMPVPVMGETYALTPVVGDIINETLIEHLLPPDGDYENPGLSQELDHKHYNFLKSQEDHSLGDQYDEIRDIIREDKTSWHRSVKKTNISSFYTESITVSVHNMRLWLISAVPEISVRFETIDTARIYSEAHTIAAVCMDVMNRQ